MLNYENEMIKMTRFTSSALFLAVTMYYRDRLFVRSRVRFCRIMLTKNNAYEKKHNAPIVDFSVTHSPYT